MKRATSFLLKLAVTILVIALIVRRYGWIRITVTAAQARAEWLLAAIVLFAASGILGAVQWRLLLKSRGVALSAGRILELYFIGLFFNNFFFGTAASDAMRVAYVKLSRESGSAGLAATFLDRLAGFVALLVCAVAGSAVLLGRGLVEGKTLTTAIVALFVTSAAFTGLLAVLVSTRLQRVLFLLIDRAPVPRKPLVRVVISRMLIETRDRRIVVQVAALSMIVQVMRIGVHVLCGLSLGLVSAVNYQYFFIFIPILAIFMIIPMPFGIREGFEGALFALAGFEENAAVVMGFLATIVSICASLPGGITFMSTRGRQPQTRENV